MRAAVLVVNTAFPEVDQLAAGLARSGLLTQYVRPYANLGRSWEQLVHKSSLVGQLYNRTFGRRRLPEELNSENTKEVAIAHDYALALAQRMPVGGAWASRLRAQLIDARTQAVAAAGARAAGDGTVVVASWGCAEPAFRRVKKRGGVCVLNYSFAHHRFVQRVLREEAEREPSFADTLNEEKRSRWLEDRFDEEIALADGVLVGSTFVGESFRSEGVAPDKLEVIPYGVNDELFQPPRVPRKRSDGSFNILFVGQIGQRKGIAYLLGAYEKVRGPETRLTLVGKIMGSGDGLRPYRELFEHIDHVPQLELADIYRKADVFVFPTLLEGMPLVVLEAMASGLPVITTPNGPGNIVRDGVDGYVVPIRDTDALADRMDHLRRDTELRMQMGRNARERATHFTWEMYRRSAIARIQELVIR